VKGERHIEDSEPVPDWSGPIPWILILACFATLFLACYAPALFGDRQFGYRDSAQYYDPLERRVQAEWRAGRWPLWEPEENAGMPLLGNPTAAVFYPGKLVFAFLPYAWSARVYVVIHTGLAFLAMLILMRGWRTSRVGSALAALSYAFGMPILFQYSNVIYLVGAAWLPLGVCAVDRWVRAGRRWGLVGLAIVLAMQTLGGDLQSAYLLGVAAGGYAAGIAWSRRDPGSSIPGPGVKARIRKLKIPLALVGLTAWFAATLALAKWLPRLRPAGFPPPPLPWMEWVPTAVSASWGLAGLGFFAHAHRNGWRSPLAVTWRGLTLSGAMAMAIVAVQILPAIEYTQQTPRATGHDLYPFSIEPIRLAELAWPNVLGAPFGRNTYWRDAMNIPGGRPDIWVPSLYMGGLTLVLACGAMAMRRGPAWRVWLTVIAVVSLAGSLGTFTSPIWSARILAEIARWPALRDWVGDVGPLDPIACPPIRLDRRLRDGDGGLYWWLAMALPGFRQFRFPAKLFTFTALGLAALAGLGWDRLRSGRCGRTSAMLAGVLVVSLVALAAAWVERAAILQTFHRPVVPSMFGPLDADGAFRALVHSLIQAAIVSGLGLLSVRLVRRRPRLAGAIALIVMTADLAWSNARYVLTVPRAVLESEPEVLRIIRDSERRRPAAGPFRIHRMPAWHPITWQSTPSIDRVRDIVAWEHDTIQPKYGINLGVEYTHTFGVGELYDYGWFFDGVPRSARTVEAARALGIEVGKEFIYFPRQSFDLWNTRYFVIPADPRGWRDPYRSYASLLFQTEPIYPEAGSPPAESLLRSREQDFQVLRNRNELPRAWVVHAARRVRVTAEMSAAARNRAMAEMVYSDDPFWHDPTLRAFDPHGFAWLDQDGESELARYLPGSSPRASETVKVSYPSPQHAELEVSLESPGMVILADVYYPGWELTIDGEPAPIYRVNRSMRGAAVPTGSHRLVYSYAPRSFRIGAILSIVGLGVLVAIAAACSARPVDPVVGVPRAL
jgi:hypothetical protein